MYSFSKRNLMSGLEPVHGPNAIDRRFGEPIYISIPTDRVKFFLDSKIFTALRARYEVHVFGQLSGQPEIERAYGGPGVFFHPAVRADSWSGRMVSRFLEAARSLGLKYRQRREPGVGIRLRYTIRYRQLAPPVERRLLLRLLLWALAWAAAKRPVWRLIRMMAYRWVVDRDFERLVTEEQPVAMIVSGQPSPQETAFALVADRQNVNCIMAPVSPDDTHDRAYLMTDYDAIVAWGPWMRRSLERFHDVDPDRIADLGVLTTRLQSEILSSGSHFDIRASLDIPDEERIVTYLSVENYETANTFAAVDALAAAARSGQLDKAVIVLRTSPWEDATAALTRYRDNPHVRVQDSATRSFDGPGTEALAEHASLVRASTVLIMGSITSSLFSAAVWAVPTIHNRAERSVFAEMLEPTPLGEKEDPSGLILAGLPVTHALDELVQLTSAYLTTPGMHDQVWDRIARDWDYQDPDYVHKFASLIG
jgi:hypothetical protein